MSSRAESKTVSQFVSLTMKLKDKLHQQRFRRSERMKHGPTIEAADPALPPENQATGALADQQRAVSSSLQYFKALVDRLGVDRQLLNQSVVGSLLGGASSGVLEAVQTLVHLEPRLNNSKTVSSCLTHLYLSVAQLIRWADQVMLQGTTHESTSSVMKVIRAVVDGVEELVQTVAERQDGSAPLSPVQSDPAMGQPGGFDDQAMSQRTATCWSPGSPAEEEMDLAPPKPPIPLLKTLPKLSPADSPPALPPKKRQSSSGPAPCRAAMAAPMRRVPEVDQQEDDCSWHSSSSSVNNTHCGQTNAESSIGFGFDLAPGEERSSHCDLTEESLSPPLSTSKTPPPLPEKKRHIHQYLQVCSSYSAPAAAMFYQRPLTCGQQHSSRLRGVESHELLTLAHQLTHLGSHSLDSAPSAELPPVPRLPLKKKQQDSVETSSRPEEKPTGDSLQRETERSQESREPQEDQEPQEEHEDQQDQEDALLTSWQEILRRITMKAEGEEGPDVRAASPEMLLVYATEADGVSGHPRPDLFREAFLATYRSFTRPDDVIRKLRHRYRHLREDRGHPADQTTASNTFHLLVAVVAELCAIELDSDLLLLLMDLVFSLLVDGELGLAHLLRSSILSKMEQKWQLIGSPQSLRPLAAKSVVARPGTLLDFRSQDLAEQLTLLDSELFYKIELPEVLLWSKEQSEEKSLNLTQFSQHFNNISFWVRSVIILQDKPQEREKLLLKFLKIMKHLRKLNNFNSYLSILSALDSAPLRRLDWQRNTAEVLEEYSSLIDSSSSFRAYRAALAEAKPPCIPYLGLILQDLTFVHLGNPDTLMTSQGSKVNFTKCWQQFNILDTLRSYQQVRYALQPDADIISFFNDFSDHLAEEALWELSLRLRPRNVPRVVQ